MFGFHPIFFPTPVFSHFLELPILTCSLLSTSSGTMSRHRQELEGRGEDPSGSGPAVWHGNEAEATEVVVYHSAILRNKRLLMAYT